MALLILQIISFPTLKLSFGSEPSPVKKASRVCNVGNDLLIVEFTNEKKLKRLLRN
jgi:hypothetical protein